MTTTTIESSVTINSVNTMYVIANGSGHSCLGFDVCLERIERIVIELVGRQALDASYLDNELEMLKAERGALSTYDKYIVLLDRLRDVCSRDGERAVYALSPQLTGLEGCRVEVVTTYGETRRFIVGRSSGWAPCHLEIARRDSSGGLAAEMEYQSVRTIARVR